MGSIEKLSSESGLSAAQMGELETLISKKAQDLGVLLAKGFVARRNNLCPKRASAEVDLPNGCRLQISLWAEVIPGSRS